jgi:hypothetical protein
MDPSQPAGSRRRTTAIIAAAGLACLAIAVPVSGAFGAGESSGTDGNASGTTPAQTQGGQGYAPGYGQPPAANGQGEPPNGQGAPHGNCPKGQGGSPGQSQGGSPGSDSSGTALPGDSVAS